MGLHEDSTLPPVANRGDREKLRPWMLLAWIVLVVICAFVLGACASQRFLTEQQDADMRKVCAETGCRVVPLPLWRDIIEFFKSIDPANRPGASTTS